MPLMMVCTEDMNVWRVKSRLIDRAHSSRPSRSLCLTMLVAKYKRVDSDDEEDHKDEVKSSETSLASSSSAPSANETSASQTSSVLTRKTVSVAPAIPEYKIDVRITIIPPRHKNGN